MGNKIVYKGAFLVELKKAFDRNLDMSIGEIMTSILHKSNFKGVNHFYIDDSEIYSSAESFNRDKDVDLPYNDFEFSEWQKKVMNG